MSYEKDFYKNIIDNLYDGVYFVDRDRRITYWNNGAERTYGWSRAEAVGQRAADLLYGEDSSQNELARRAGTRGRRV